MRQVALEFHATRQTPPGASSDILLLNPERLNIKSTYLCAPPFRDLASAEGDAYDFTYYELLFAYSVLSKRVKVISS